MSESTLPDALTRRIIESASHTLDLTTIVNQLASLRLVRRDSVFYFDSISASSVCRRFLFPTSLEPTACNPLSCLVLRRRAVRLTNVNRVGFRAQPLVEAGVVVAPKRDACCTTGVTADAERGLPLPAEGDPVPVHRLGLEPRTY